MLRISAATRLSLGMSFVVLSATLAAYGLGLLGQGRHEAAEARRVLCESIAVQCCRALERDDRSTVRSVLESLVERYSGARSAQLTRVDGTLIAAAGDVASTADAQQYQVPIQARGETWGRLNVTFASHAPAGWGLPFESAEMRGVAFIGCVTFLAFLLYLRHILRHLDPAAVIPARVRAMLDQLAEGVLVLDRRERIVLANRSIAQHLGRTPEQLQGRRPGRLGWRRARSDQNAAAWPWSQAIGEGVTRRGALLDLETRKLGRRTFAVNSAPILGPDGHRRGALATFDDVTSVERKNVQLEQMLVQVSDSREEIQRQNEELNYLASHDPLTGCLNRRAFFLRFDHHWQATGDRDLELSCLMLDVDHFKSVNDNHGHAVGDEVLKAVSRIVREGVRSEDVVARFGGEEFCVLMPRTGAEEARKLSEQLRQMIAAEPCGPLRITASFGCATRGESVSDPQGLVELSDRALYYSKQTGRNRVSHAASVPADFQIEKRAGREKPVTIDEERELPVPFPAVTALLSALAFRDAHTAEHSRRVADGCVRLAQGRMSQRACYLLEVAALLHDIGKLGVPDSILLKPGPLSEAEWEIMRRHDRIGVEIIAAAFAAPEITEIVRTLPSRYDGRQRDSSLPAGAEIPLGARILAIIDAYDSITADQVFRAGRRPEVARAELQRCAGTQFDPELVEAFLALWESTPHGRRRDDLAVSKPTALRIGQQMERLARALDERDFTTLSTLAQRLSATARRDGIVPLAQLAGELATASQGEPELLAVVGLTLDLLELCRQTRAIYIRPELAVRDGATFGACDGASRS